MGPFPAETHHTASTSWKHSPDKKITKHMLDKTIILRSYYRPRNAQVRLPSSDPIQFYTHTIKGCICIATDQVSHYRHRTPRERGPYRLKSEQGLKTHVSVELYHQLHSEQTTGTHSLIIGKVGACCRCLHCEPLLCCQGPLIKETTDQYHSSTPYC